MVRKRKQPKKCSADMECHAHSIRNLLLARRWDEVLELLGTHGEALVEYMQEEEGELLPSNSAHLQYYGQCLTARERSIVKTIVSLMTFNKTPPTNFFRLLFDLNPNFITKYIPSERYCVGYSATPQNIMMYNQFNGPMQTLLQNLNFLSSAPQEASQQYLNDKQIIQEVIGLIIEKNPNALILPSKPHDILPLHLILTKSMDTSSALMRIENSWKEFLLWQPKKDGKDALTRDAGAATYYNEGEGFHGTHTNASEEMVVDTTFLNNFFQSMIKTRPTSLVLPNKGGITCLELFWQAYAKRDVRWLDDNDGNNDFLLHSLVAAQWYYHESGRGSSSSASDADDMQIESYQPHLKSPTQIYTKRIYPCLVTVIDTSFAGARMFHIMNSSSSSEETLAVFDDEFDDDVTARIHTSPLHKATALPCTPIDMIEFLFDVHSNHELIDANGNTPMHLALGALWDENGSGIIIPKSIKSVQRSVGDTFELISMLARVGELNGNNDNNNMASIPNYDGYYPLFIALQRGFLGWDDGVGILFDAYSDVTSQVDPENHFPPFIYAAIDKENTKFINVNISKKDRGKNQLNIIYKLLRASPDMIHHVVKYHR